MTGFIKKSEHIANDNDNDNDNDNVITCYMVLCCIVVVSNSRTPGNILICVIISQYLTTL